MAGYQTQADPTKVMGRRIGAWMVDGLIAFGLFAAVFAATVDYDTLSDEGARAIFGEENLCDAVEGGDLEGSNFCGPVDITITRPVQPDVVLKGRAVLFADDQNYLIDPASGTAAWLAALAYGVGITWILQGVAGMTLGKALFGIRTVDEQGKAPGLGKALIRWLLWVVDAIPYCTLVPLVGGITAMASKGHRRVGDMAAKTYVVDKAHMGNPILLPGAAAPGSGAFAAAPPAEAGEARWDPQRNAYIMWDAPGERWLRFDDSTQQWSPIE